MTPAGTSESIPIKSNNSQGAALNGTVGTRRNTSGTDSGLILCFQMINSGTESGTMTERTGVYRFGSQCFRLPSPADRCEAPPRGGKGGIFSSSEEEEKNPTLSLTTPDRGRRFEGRDPVGDGWHVVAEFAGWKLWKSDADASGWCRVKLVLVADRDHRSNLSFAWNGERFSKSSDVAWLEQHRPEALLLAELALKEWQHGKA